MRFALETAATKKDVKVVFKAKELKVTVAGKELFNSKLNGPTYPDDSTYACAANIHGEYTPQSAQMNQPCPSPDRVCFFLSAAGGAWSRRARNCRFCSLFRKMSSGTAWWLNRS